MTTTQIDLDIQIARILQDAGISAEAEHKANFNVDDTPEYVTVKTGVQYINKVTTIQEDWLMLKARVNTTFTVVCDKDHVSNTDLDCRVVAEIAKKHKVSINSVKSVIGNKFNKYIINADVHDVVFSEMYSEDEMREGYYGY